MKRPYRLNELECAVCASKMEGAIRKLDGVISVSIQFMAQKMVLEAQDEVFDRVLEQAKKAIKRVEPDCSVVEP